MRKPNNNYLIVGLLILNLIIILSVFIVVSKDKPKESTKVKYEELDKALFGNEQ